MAAVKALKQFKETEGKVPNHVGPERGRAVMVKFHPTGVWVKAKGKRDSIFIGWDEIYSYAAWGQAKERAKENWKGK